MSNQLDRLSIQCVAPDKRTGEQLAMAFLDGVEVHRDRLNVDTDWKRENFSKSTFRKAEHEIVDPNTHRFKGNGLAKSRIIEEISQKLIEAADSADSENGQAPIEKLKLGELIEKYPNLHPPVIEGLLREGETCNIIAAPKRGKSWLVYDVALSIVMGQKLFGQFECTAGDVLLIDNELHAATIANRIPKVGNAKELFPADYQNKLEVWPLRGKLRTLQELKYEFDPIPRGKFKAIICDARYRFQPLGTSENDNSAATEIYNTIEAYADQLGAAFILIHHSSKGDQSDKSVVDVGAGAGAQARAADCHLVLRQHEQGDTIVLEAAVRSFAPAEPLALQWDFPLWRPDSSADTSKLQGSKSKQQQQQAERDREGCEQIINVLRDSPATSRKLREATAISRDRMERLLNLLISDDQIQYTTTKVKGNECREYFIPETPF